MRKIILFVTALMAAATTNAQLVLWNGEDKDVGTDGGFWNRADPTVVEEDGNKFLKITLKENSGEGKWADEHRMAALPLGGGKSERSAPHLYEDKDVREPQCNGKTDKRWKLHR